ncbi:MAG: SDR family NAD(P)-dependent oxidoreductase [Burkholderiales bacterium]
MDIDGMAAVITGGATGMGAAAATALAARGAKVTILARRREQVEAKAREIGALGLACDIANPDEVAAAFEAAEAAHGTARICINCAADGRPATILYPDGRPFPAHIFGEVIGTNLLGTMYVAQAFASRLVKATELEGVGRGVLINVSSNSAEDGMVGAAYVSSKAGVDALTLSLAREFSPWGIRVMTIVPGAVDTEMMRAAAGPESYEYMEKGYVYPRRMGKPGEFAGLAVHIIENDFLNGTRIRLDGGLRVYFTGGFVRKPDEISGA